MTFHNYINFLHCVLTDIDSWRHGQEGEYVKSRGFYLSTTWAICYGKLVLVLAGRRYFVHHHQ